MDFTEVTLNSRSLFNRYLKSFSPRVSELTFTNLFAWRYYYKIKYAELNEYLCIIAEPQKETPYAFMPIGEYDEASFDSTILEITKYFKNKNWKPVFKKITEDELKYFQKHVKSPDDIVYDRDNSDYLYLTSDLIYLRGKKFDGKRNHLNKFKKNNTFFYVPLECSLISECSRIMEDWCKTKNCDCKEGDYCERLANMEILNNYKALDCKGALINVNGKFEAFSVGEMITKDTAVIHIEKADTRIEGLYPLINQQFCENAWHDTIYINREQDLGMEGMRKAKLSYNPIKMVDKYFVYVS